MEMSLNFNSFNSLNTLSSLTSMINIQRTATTASSTTSTMIRIIDSKSFNIMMTNNKYSTKSFIKSFMNNLKISKMSSLSLLISILLTFMLSVNQCNCQEQPSSTIITKDSLEGDTIRLECHYNPFKLQEELQLKNSRKLIYYWHRKNNERTEPVAINDNTLESDYLIEFNNDNGLYDLIIKKAKYDRDNGRFECKIKEAGNGAEILSYTYLVTILIPPGPPIITPTNPIAREGEKFQLNCSSIGGSPDPLIQWYHDGKLLDGIMINGGQRNRPTFNTLTIDPTIEHDRSIYKCVVWNRAQENKLESFVSLTVHYKPRITVGPYNPLMVQNDGNAEMSCMVKSNPPIRSIRWMKNGMVLANTNNHTILRVKPEDSGHYDCVADNGIGDQPSNKSLELVVQYGPQINLLSFKEVTNGENLNIKCNVISNPKPQQIVWYKENDSYFKKIGSILSLNSITPNDSGNYICSATTIIKPSGVQNGIEKTSNATIKIQIKHAPGKAEITPKNPVAFAGKSYTLHCQANPPGYPQPEYRWWKEGSEHQELGTRANYTFIAVHVSHEGRYYCQPSNQIGKGIVGSVYLSVNEPAQMTIPMKPQFIVKEGATNFKLTCIGRGKPRPNVIWTHNDQEINPDNSEYRIENKEQNEDADVKTIQTTLYFESMTRKNINTITANDRGHYACHYNNGIGDTVKSETVVRVEHTPVLHHTYNRVAFDVGETAILQCKMSAYPTPKFEWFFSGKMLDNYFNERYQTNSTELPDDIHIGQLSIRNTKESDYGDYTCRAFNSIGDDDERTIIKLVKKSAPETPMQLEVLEVLSDSVTLRWLEGFNGGFSNTEFIVNYIDNTMANDQQQTQRNESCRTLNPCKITSLESRHEYQFRVLAVNPRGYSHYSDPIKVVTKVNLKDMPSAYDSMYDRERNILIFHVDPNDVNLRLIAKIEIRNDLNQHHQQSTNMSKESKINKTSNPINSNSNSNEWIPLTKVQVLSDLENVYLKQTNEPITDIRIILCLQSNESWCGYEHLVKMDSHNLNGHRQNEMKLSSTQDYLFNVIIISIIVGIIICFVVLCCCWKKRDKLMLLHSNLNNLNNNSKKVDFDSDTTASVTDNNPMSNHHHHNHMQSQMSPNYFSSHDNKGLMSDMENSNLNKLSSSLYGSTYMNNNNFMNQQLSLPPPPPHVQQMNMNYQSQNYYLTGDPNSVSNPQNNSGDPSPNSSQETGQTEFWNSLKSQHHQQQQHLSPYADDHAELLNNNSNNGNNQSYQVYYHQTSVANNGYQQQSQMDDIDGHLLANNNNNNNKMNLSNYYDEMTKQQQQQQYNGSMIMDQLSVTSAAAARTDYNNLNHNHHHGGGGVHHHYPHHLDNLQSDTGGGMNSNSNNPHLSYDDGSMMDYHSTSQRSSSARVMNEIIV